MKDEIVLYQPDDSFQLDVLLQDETVWLTQQQMADLFQKDQSVIARHISNIFKEGELDKSNMQILHNTISKYRPTAVYNLDVIISVGYRVKSQRGTQFRRWANKVLKDYILRGYAIDQRLIAIENSIDRRFHVHEQRLEKVEKQVDFFVRTNLPPVEQVFFGGEFFEARVLLERIIKSAQKRIIVIDEYIDAATFEMLDVRSKGVTADIYSSGSYSTLRDAHNATIGIESILTHKWSNASHDRWLIVDDKLYHCGHSLKDMGKKLSAITLMGESPETILKQVI